MKRNINHLRGDRTANIIINLCLVIVAFLTIYPLWYVLIASVSDPGAIASGKVILWPVGFNLEGYLKLFETKKIWVGYRNSLIYTVVGTIVNLAVQLPCAYALSRKTLPYRKTINTLLIITMYFSGGIVPSYILMSKLHLIDNPLALILPSALSVYNVILARNYFEGNIPESLFEAAKMEGCSYTRFFGQIVLPLSKPIIAIIALFSAQTNWNQYFSAKMYIYKAKYQTLQQVIAQITAKIDTTLTALDQMSAQQMAQQALEKQLMKFSVVIVAALPMILLYPLIQKFFIKGIMVGAVKG